MSTPIDVDATRESSQHSLESHTPNSTDIINIQKWIDHPDWDVLEKDLSLSQDIADCQMALENGCIRPLSVDKQPGLNGTDSRKELPPFPDTNHSAGTVMFARHRFHNVRFLGAGGYGVVFAAEDKVLGISIAIKFLRPSGASSECRLSV